jgi:hypothetical protein
MDISQDMKKQDILMKEITSYPNPTATSTTIRFNLVDKTTVSMQVFDVTGKVVATPIQEKPHAAGTHEVSLDLSKLGHGVYYATLKSSDGKKQTIKIIKSK